MLEARSSGRGQVVDAAITDGAIHLMTHFLTQQQRGQLSEQRADNLLDGGAPWYGVYATADDRFIAIGAIEPAFFGLLLQHLGLDAAWKAAQNDRAAWPAMREAIAAAVLRKTRDEWTEVFDGTDACVAPVMSLGEAPSHPHNLARGNFVTVDGVLHPAAAPRFSRTSPGPDALRAALATTLDEVRARWQRR